jgi:uncharacterized protein YggL (DUF469 family)
MPRCGVDCWRRQNSLTAARGPLGETPYTPLRLDESFSPLQIEHATDALLYEVVEVRGLGMGGWLSGGYIQAMDRPSATNEDREAMRAWLEARPEVKSVRIGPLVDAWYPPNVS